MIRLKARISRSNCLVSIKEKELRMTSLPAKRPLSRDDIYRKATAYHESGHAVMAVCLGGTIIKPGVRIDAAWHCQARFRYGPLD